MRINYPKAILDDDDEEQRIEQLLNEPTRANVIHSFSLHNMTVVDNGMKLHLVLKFKYDESCISLFGAQKPENDVEKKYGVAHRIFPYCIFNSIEESPISWTYQNRDGEVYERIELFTTVTIVKYMRYYPFELKLLNLKVGTDGTAKTGLINLLPELKENKKGLLVPNVDFGVFKKETAQYRIASDGIETGDVICRMVVRDLSDDTLGNLSGIYTRVYTVFFFESKWFENLVKYVLFSTIMTNLTIFIPVLELSSVISLVLAVALTEVALLFVMPDTDDFTTAEAIVIGQALYILLQSFVVGLTCNYESNECLVNQWYVFLANMGATILTILWGVREYRAYLHLVRKIKGKFKSVHAYVGMFKDIDMQI